MKLYKDKFENKSKAEVEANLRSVFKDQQERIAKALELPEGVEVVLCPSGSDAEYITVAMARALQPDPNQKIVNVVTQLKEIGAGSSVASGGEYFSTHAPLVGRIPDGKTKLDGFEGVEEISIPARERDGTVIDATTVAAKTAADARKEGHYTIVHGVFGGKTGLRDSEMPGSEGAGLESMGVVDACQGRFSLEELHSWLAKDSVVLFTGSKFFQAPPFCGAAFIPPRMAAELKKARLPPANMFTGLSEFFTDMELSDCFSSWAPALSSSSVQNVGLALRWEAGLVGMEALSPIADSDRVKAVEKWASQVTDLVTSKPELDPWCVERSIVSIRISKGNGEWLSMKELRDVYRYLSKDVSSVVSDVASPDELKALSVCCSLGQPVDVSETHAILRIALGSESLASYLDDPEKTLKEDEMAVEKLAAIAKYFSSLQESDL